MINQNSDLRIFSDPYHHHHAPLNELKAGVMGKANEGPDRLIAVLDHLTKEGFPAAISPKDFGIDVITAVHDADYVRFMKEAWESWLGTGRTGDLLPLVWPGAAMRRDVSPETIDGQIGLYCFDIGTPITKETYRVAYGAAQCAAAAADIIAQGMASHAVSLTRPPGHHAMPAAYGGYCFFNQAAIAAQLLRQKGYQKVAILDVDYHHGNGTQTIFYDRPDVMVINLHADPKEEYPYFLGHADEIGLAAGKGFNLNLPMPKGISWQSYRSNLRIAIEAVKNYAPDALVVSLGVDTGADDPLGYFSLTVDNFNEMGGMIAALQRPLVTVLEGGYDRTNIGAYVAAYLEAAS